MDQVYVGALRITMGQIRMIGELLSKVSDQYDLVSLQDRFNKLLKVKAKIQKRIKQRHNVLYVDFKTKKRVA
jgi:hypothetical protein